jgi:hypothetical protein
MKFTSPNLLWKALLLVLLLCADSARGEEGRAQQTKQGQAEQSGRDTTLALAIGMDVPVVTSFKELDKCLGRVVALRGVVSEGNKIPYLLGVQINCDDELRGKEVYALGILKKFEVKEVDPLTANSGPGIKYNLYYDLNGELAKARALPK